MGILDDPAMRDAEGRPLPWLRDILQHRDRIEGAIRGIHGSSGSLTGYCTWQLMGITGCELRARAHRHLVNSWAPKKMWSDPVL